MQGSVTKVMKFEHQTLDFHGVFGSGRDSLRGMLARLQPKEEVLLLGWGVPMPLPVRSRRYDESFWKEMGKSKRSSEEINRELGFGNP